MAKGFGYLATMPLSKTPPEHALIDLLIAKRDEALERVLHIFGGFAQNSIFSRVFETINFVLLDCTLTAFGALWSGRDIF